MDTVTITEDEAFIELKKTLLTSERNIEIALNTALKIMEEVSQIFLYSKTSWANMCKQAELTNEILGDNIELMEYICDTMYFEEAKTACKAHLGVLKTQKISQMTVTEYSACIAIPTFGLVFAETARGLAKITTWTARIA